MLGRNLREQNTRAIQVEALNPEAKKNTVVTKIRVQMNISYRSNRSSNLLQNPDVTYTKKSLRQIEEYKNNYKSNTSSIDSKYLSSIIIWTMSSKKNIIWITLQSFEST